MNYEFKSLLPADFAPDSKVWIYQSSRLFSVPEALAIEKTLQNFVEAWQSHGTPVKGYGNLFFGQFIVLMADEAATGVSGCSTDSSVRMIKSIELELGVQLFDRTTLAFIQEGKTQLLPLSQLSYAIERGYINGETIYFNNLAATRADLEKNWLVPVKNSWLGQRYQLKVEQ